MCHYRFSVNSLPHHIPYLINMSGEPADIFTHDNGFSTAFSGAGTGNGVQRVTADPASRTGSISSQSNSTPVLRTQLSQYGIPTPHSPADALFPQQYPHQMPPDGRFPADPPAWASSAPPASTSTSLASPPYSAGPFPRDMSFGFPPGPPSSFLNPTQTQRNSHDPFGQMTPPFDPDGSLFDSQLQQQQMLQQQQYLSNNESPYGPSRNITPDRSSQVRSKRPRKYNSRRAKASSVDHDSEGETRRNKFLERNRVAASKCRQKKKEQQRGLEDMARRLQRENNLLLSERTSMNDEIEFLRDQVEELRRICNCTRVTEGDARNHRLSLNDSNGIDDLGLKMESDNGAELEVSRLPHRSLGGVNPEPNELGEEFSTPNTKPVDEHELRALLTDSIKHQESSDEGSSAHMESQHLDF